MTTPLTEKGLTNPLQGVTREDSYPNISPLKTRIKGNKNRESKIIKKVLKFCKENLSDSKYK